MPLYYEHGDIVAEYVDKNSATLSAKCQPRDIHIVQVTRESKVLKLRTRDINSLKEKIAIDVRLGQGLSPIGVAKNLLTQ